MNNFITFILPFYNASEYISEALDSLLAQSSSDWQIICIDDGSIDTSLSIVEGYAVKDKRINIIKQENSGPGVARARAICNVTSEFCAILDADDKLDIDYVKTIKKRIEETNADIVVPEVQYFCNNNDKMYRHFQNFGISTNSVLKGGEEAFLLTVPWRLHGWMLMRTDLAQRYYTEDAVSYNKFNSDEFITRIIYYNSQKVAISNALYLHRENDNSITKKIKLSHVDYLVNLYKLYNLAIGNKMSKSAIASIYSEFIIEVVTMWQKKDFLPTEEKTQAEQKIIEYYNKFRDNYKLSLFSKQSIRLKIKMSVAMSGFYAVKLFAKIRAARQLH